MTISRKQWCSNLVYHRNSVDLKTGDRSLNINAVHLVFQVAVTKRVPANGKQVETSRIEGPSAISRFLARKTFKTCLALLDFIVLGDFSLL
jgi:hypothetical protein